MERMHAIGVALSFLCLSVVGCGKQDNPAAEKKELVLLCGSSFVPPTDKLIEQFKAKTGVEIVTTSAGSEDFLPLVKTGQKGDVLVTHDPYMDYVKEAKAYLDNAEVGFVAPVLAVTKGNPKGIKCIEDLAKPGLRVGLSNPKYSTCGEMVFKLLEKKGIKEAVLKNVENRLTKGHGNLGTLLQTGAVDAVIMWNGVAHTFKDHLEIVPTPYEYDTSIRVHVIGLGYSKHPELVKQFASFAKQQGQGIFASFGYVK
ncbi:MAG: extracellular solute-binding protein [Phycisphaerae bacterium]|nr:extracellular solute-binding protein [Phycisphaerae bacterium]